MSLLLPTIEELTRLNHSQRRFVDEYCVDFNGSAAARRAGYAHQTAGLMALYFKNNHDIAKAISRRMAHLGMNTELTKAMLVAQLRKLAFGDLRRVVAWGNPDMPGVVLVASDKLDDDAAACVSEVSNTREGVKIKVHDKTAAVAQLSKMMGYDVTKIELSGANGDAIRTVSASMTAAEAAEAYKATRGDD